MRRPLLPTLLLLAVGTTLLTASLRKSDSQEAGSLYFTGQVKPVIYVSDLEKSSPFYLDVLGFVFLKYA